jgi:capsular polysaccharide biosynthesis protein
MNEPRRIIEVPPYAKAAEDEEYVLSVKHLFQIVRRRLWVVALVILSLVGAAVGLSLVQTPQYVASVTVLVGQDQGISETPGDAAALQDLTQTMAQAVASRRVAEGVIQRLDLPDSPETVLGNLGTEQIPDTQFVQVSYQDPNPEKAARVANAIGHVFSDQLSEVSPNDSAITATVWDEAVAPDTPTSPDPVRNGILSLLLGGVLGLGLVFLLEYLDDSWRSPEETERVSGVPTFGVIPQFKDVKAKGKKGQDVS